MERPSTGVAASVGPQLRQPPRGCRNGACRTTGQTHIPILSLMASAGKLDLELELKSSADELWSAIKDANNVFPKVLPEMYKSIEVLEGDGKSAGSVRLVTLAEGSQQFTPFAHSKVEYVDEENKAVGFRVVGGDLLSHYKNYKANIVVKTNGEGSILHWSIEFEKASEETPNPDAIRDFSAKLFQGLDAYLLSENKS